MLNIHSKLICLFKNNNNNCLNNYLNKFLVFIHSNSFNLSVCYMTNFGLNFHTLIIYCLTFEATVYYLIIKKFYSLRIQLLGPSLSLRASHWLIAFDLWFGAWFLERWGLWVVSFPLFRDDDIVRGKLLVPKTPSSPLGWAYSWGCAALATKAPSASLSLSPRESPGIEDSFLWLSGLDAACYSLFLGHTLFFCLVANSYILTSLRLLAIELRVEFGAVSFHSSLSVKKNYRLENF